MIRDEPVDPDTEQLAGTGRGVDGPGENEVCDLAQLRDDPLVEQALVDRDPVEPVPGEPPQERSTLALAPHGRDPADGQIDEGVEEAPVAGADREPAPREVGLDLTAHEVGKGRAPPLEVEHQLGRLARRGEEVGEDEAPPSRRCELPAIPVEGQGADRLQMPDLGAPVEEPDVSLDQRDAELLDSTQLLDAVPGAVRHHERRRAGTDDQRAVGDRRPHCAPV